MMKKLLIMISALVFVLGFYGFCFGNTLTDITTFDMYGTTASVDLVSYGGTYVDKLEYSSDWVKWTHYYNFDPPATAILSGTLEILLRDDEYDTWNLRTWDFGIGWGEDGTWDLGDVDSGTYAYDVNIGYLADEEFTVTLASLLGDFYIEQSKLTIEYTTGSDPVSASVPDVSIMFLLGPILIVLGIISRRKFRT